MFFHDFFFDKDHITVSLLLYLGNFILLHNYLVTHTSDDKGTDVVCTDRFVFFASDIIAEVLLTSI